MKRSIKNLVQFGCALAILVALPSYASKYYCNGIYGDANQAKKKYMGTTAGSYVTVQQCKKVSD